MSQPTVEPTPTDDAIRQLNASFRAYNQASGIGLTEQANSWLALVRDVHAVVVLHPMYDAGNDVIS